MRSSLAGLLLLVLGPGPEARERVLAVLNGLPLTLTEVQSVERVRGLGQAAAVEALIDERLMFDEASRLPEAAVSAAEEERGAEALFQKQPDLRETVPPEDVRRLIHRQATILKYVEFRFRPQVRVGDDRLKAAYDAAYGGRPHAPLLAEVEASLRERLVRQDLDQRIEAWVRELRAGAEIRYNP
jgi:hypothetical protein